MSSAPRILSLVFHGNCIDGWFSAYILQGTYTATHTINYYPISPNMSHTWPTTEKITGTDVILADVSVPEGVLVEWEAVAASVFCIDHHATTAPQWKCAHRAGRCVHDTEACAALLTWRHVFGADCHVPEWIHQVDRIDRWHNVTRMDRVLREHLHTIAQLPVRGNVAEAIRLTNEYIVAHVTVPVYPQYLGAIIAKGETALSAKEDEIRAVLRGGTGKVVTIMPAMCEMWKLDPDAWVGKRGFIIDTTGIPIDSTEAGHIAMDDYGVEFFINYRLKTYTNPRGVTTKTYIYSARSKDSVNLTEGGTIFSGHPCSAGASLRIEKEGAVAPFVFDV